MSLIFKLIFAIIFVEAITEIVTKSDIFRPLRSKFFTLASSNKFFSWLHSLLDCGYCFSVWCGLFTYFIFFFKTEFLHWSIDWFVVSIILHRLSNILHNIIDKTHE